MAKKEPIVTATPAPTYVAIGGGGDDDVSSLGASETGPVGSPPAIYEEYRVEGLGQMHAGPRPVVIPRKSVPGRDSL